MQAQQVAVAPQRKRPEPTSPENLKRIDAMFTAIEPVMSYAWSRWQDEKEYEDIAEYGEYIQKNLPEGFTLKKMTKRPFGFEFTIGTDAVYYMTMNGRQFQWKRIA